MLLQPGGALSGTRARTPAGAGTARSQRAPGKPRSSSQWLSGGLHSAGFAQTRAGVRAQQAQRAANPRLAGPLSVTSRC